MSHVRTLRRSMIRFLVLLVCATIVGGFAGVRGTHPSDAAAQVTPPSPMSSPRYAHSVAEVNGKLYAIGGTSSATGSTGEVYDPASNTWTPIATASFGHLGAASIGGIVYAGASGGTPLEAYDPASNTWTQLAASRPLQISSYGTAALDGKLYIVGGFTSMDVVATVEAYDPLTNQWETRAPMPTARWGLRVAVSGGKLYAIGGSSDRGFSQIGTVEEYDPIANSWRARASMPTARYSHGVATAPDGTIYAMGGAINGGGGTMTVERYDPVANTWQSRARMPAPRFLLGAGTAGDGRIYAVGGRGETDAVLATVDSYDPVSNEWLPDYALPTIQSFAVNSGALTTNSPNVTLSLAATDGGTGVVDMSFSNDGINWSTPVPYATQTSWTLSPGDGGKTIRARVRDGNQNISAVALSSIILDTGTLAGLVSINGGTSSTNSLNATLTLQVADQTNDVREMRFSNTNNGADWSDWEPYSAAKAWPLAAGADGTRTVFAQFRDSLENVAPTFSDTIVYDTVAPTVTSLSINQGAQTTTTTTVSLVLQVGEPAGGNGIAARAFSNDGGATWSAWEAYAATKSWTLPGGDGPKTVQVRVRDTAGNVSQPASDTITLDTRYGSSFGISINNAAVWTNTPDVTLSISAAPGTARMMLSNDGGFVGAAWEPFTTSKPWRLDQFSGSSVTMVVYVRFGDANGAELPNSSGRSDNIVLDTTPPTGSVAVSGASVAGQREGGSVSVQSPTRTVQLTASDTQSGSAMTMRLSNRADFAGASWKPFDDSVTWDFGGGSTVYAQFRDGAGNVSQTYSQTLPGSAPPGVSPTTSCSPRPPVQVSLQKSNGALVATLTTTGASNGLRAVRFDTFTNASVDVGSQTGQTAPFAVSIPAGQEPTSLQFTVRRAPGAPSATVRLVVIDGCGEWSTFVGGGPGAF